MTEVSPKSNSHVQNNRFNGIENQIGGTPLIPLDIEIETNSKLFVKAEYLNPGGSVKDRPAWYMIKTGLLSGELTEEKTIIDASSGNTGIALAMIGSSLGYPVTICLPQNASLERKQLINAYGAEIIETDPLEGTDGAIQKVQEIVGDNPASYYYTDQYNNNANWMAHYETTGPEIFSQTDGKITHFITGLGTSGTFRGISTYLNEKIPDIKTISVQPDTPFHGLEGMKHMETAITPGIYDPNLATANMTISTKEAYKTTKWLAEQRGLLTGISSGANVSAAIKLANQVENGIIVTILCDRGDRYLSDKFWSENNE